MNEGCPALGLKALINRIDRLVACHESDHAAMQARIGDYERALMDAAEEIDRTRENFRSRRLGELRRRIERVLRDGA